jgi:hypothetical protein
MPKRKLMYLIGFILTISLVASIIYINWNTDTTSTIPGENDPEDNTEPPADDNTEPPPDDNTDAPPDDNNVIPPDDATPPMGTIVINGDSASTNSVNVILTLSASDPESEVSQMCFRNSGCSWSSWELYSTSKSWTLTSGDGTKTVEVQFENEAGLNSTTYSDTIILETSPPTGSIIINDGAATTNSTIVILTLTASDPQSGVASMRFRNSGGSWSNLMTYKTPISWTLTSGDGPKTVEVEYVNGLGMISDIFQDTITLETPSVAVYHDLSIVVIGSGVTSPSAGIHTYEEDSTIPVTATPANGWSFSHWLRDSVNAGSNNPYTVTIDADNVLTAVFAEVPPDDTPNYFLNLTIAEAIGNNEADHENAEDYIWDSSDATTITLNTDSISVDNGNGALIDGTTVTITAAGTYNISGVLVNGQIIVDTADDGIVRLVFNGININSATNAPVYVEQANKTIIVLADKTENYLTDNGGNADNATLFSRDDLTIYGNGSLTVTGNDNDAIRSNDGLIIKNGNITVNSVDDGIRGKNYLVIKGGSITVDSVGDGLKSDNAADERRGYIFIEGGTIDITSTKGDAITAQTDLLISDGNFTVTSGGGNAVSPNDDLSTKGLKSIICIVIDGGNFVISSSDDAIHSDHMILINNSMFNVSSGDEGLNAFSSIEINDATIVITKSNDGIQSGNVTINNSSIQVSSSDDGVSSTDFLTIKDADIIVNSVGDGLKSDNNENATEGNLYIDNCTITVTSTMGDAITAQVDLMIGNGTFQLTSGGGSTVPPNDNISTKGLKSGGNITIENGEFVISASDDAINSNDRILINNGTYQLATGDDGIHADNSIEINDGTFIITQSYEGIESTNVTINDGHIEITSSDDGINVAGDDAGGMGGFGPAGGFYIFIKGGFIYINSGTDGLDSDGYIEMSGGTVIIDGPIPSSFPNGAIDYGNGAFNMTDGLLVAVGMSGMAQGPSPTSTQYSVIINLNVQRPANTLVHLQTTSGETVLTFKPTKAYQSIVFSSPDLAPGSYDLYLGGSSTGTLSYGIYEDGTYTPGTKYTTFTISQITTTVGGGGGFFWP